MLDAAPTLKIFDASDPPRVEWNMSDIRLSSNPHCKCLSVGEHQNRLEVAEAEWLVFKFGISPDRNWTGR
jgi:hypothetical protein